MEIENKYANSLFPIKEMSPHAKKHLEEKQLKGLLQVTLDSGGPTGLPRMWRLWSVAEIT